MRNPEVVRNRLVMLTQCGATNHVALASAQKSDAATHRAVIDRKQISSPIALELLDERPPSSNKMLPMITCPPRICSAPARTSVFHSLYRVSQRILALPVGRSALGVADAGFRIEDSFDCTGQR